MRSRIDDSLVEKEERRTGHEKESKADEGKEKEQ